jgi:hypothetical protein
MALISLCAVAHTGVSKSKTSWYCAYNNTSRVCKESIVNPDTFIIPGYPNIMLKGLGDRLTPASLDKLVDFLLILLD